MTLDGRRADPERGAKAGGGRGVVPPRSGPPVHPRRRGAGGRAVRDCAHSTAAARRPGEGELEATRVVIAAGGTAGHVVPAIAVADALRASGRAEVSFLGTRERAEAELVPAAGYEIDFLRVSGLDRRNPLRAAAAGRAATAVRAARRVLRARGAGAVLGGGGYVAGPAGLAAVTMGLPLVLTEADSHLGLANRLLASRARRVCLAFPIAGREGDPYWSPGARCRGPCSRPTAAPRGAASGSRRANPASPSSAAASAPGRSTSPRSTRRSRRSGRAAGSGVVHVAGRRDYAELRARLGACATARGRRRLCAARVRALARRRARRRGPRVALRRRLGDGDRRRRAARDPRPLPACDRRPPGRPTPAGWQEGGAAMVIPDAELTARGSPPRHRRAARGRRRLERMARRLAPAGAARRRRADRRARCWPRGGGRP